MTRGALPAGLPKGHPQGVLFHPVALPRGGHEVFVPSLLAERLPPGSQGEKTNLESRKFISVTAGRVDGGWGGHLKSSHYLI